MFYKIDSGNTNFKAKISALKPHSGGELNYRISRKIGPIKSALEEILRGKSSIKATTGLEILENGIKIIAPVLGISAFTLTLPKDAHSNSLDISIIKADNSEEEIKIIKNKILKPNTKKFYTSQELKTLNIDSRIEMLLDSADIPLLELRQSLHPKQTILLPVILPPEEKVIDKTITDTVEIIKPTTEQTIIKDSIRENRGLSKKSENKFNSESEIDKILNKLLLIPPKITKPQTVLTEPTTNTSIGRLTNNDKQLILEVCELFKELDELFEKNNRVLNYLAKKFPSYDKYRKGQLISLKGLEGDDTTLSFTISIAKRMFNNPIHIICKRDSKHTIQEFIPIYGNKVLHVKDSLKQGEIKSLIHYIRKNVHMTPDQIERLHISHKLALIKEELIKYINYLKNGDTESLSIETSKRLANFEKDLLEVKKVAKNRRSTCYKSVTRKPTSVFTINDHGDKIAFTPKSENRYNRAFAVLEVFNKLKKESKGVGIYQDKLVKNYPIKNNRKIPQKLKLCSNEDFANHNIEAELNRILDILERQLVLIKKSLKISNERS